MPPWMVPPGGKGLGSMPGWPGPTFSGDRKGDGKRSRENRDNFGRNDGSQVTTASLDNELEAYFKQGKANGDSESSGAGGGAGESKAEARKVEARNFLDDQLTKYMSGVPKDGKNPEAEADKVVDVEGEDEPKDAAKTADAAEAETAAPAEEKKDDEKEDDAAKEA